MKIAISGKGGTGKTTLAGILAHFFRSDGYKVLAVDADPDANLASAIGIPPELALSLKPISEQRQLIKERTGANPRQFGQLFKLNPTVSDIPDDFSLDYQGIKLLVMGAVRKGGEGCACPENVLLKNLLSEIILERKEVVIVDMEAGIEHLGRATAGSIERLLIVVEPGARSIETAKKIMKLGKEIGLQDFGIIGNKILDKHQREWIKKRFDQNLIFGMIPFDQNILEADLQQKSPIDSLHEDSKAEFMKIYNGIRR
jgi:CO dehydrogenase maturation factor